MTNDDCKAKYKSKNVNFIYDTLLCTLTSKGNGVLCHGDAGSPLVNENGALVGIALFNFALDKDCGTTQPDSFTRISSYLDWIMEYADVQVIDEYSQVY